MNLNPYKNDFEVLEDYKVFLSLLKKVIRKQRARDWEPELSSGKDSPTENKKNRDPLKELWARKHAICKRMAITRKKGISLRINQVASRYNLNSIELDIVLMLAIEELMRSERFVSPNEIISALSRDNLKKAVTIRENLQRMAKEKIISTRTLERPMGLSLKIFQEIVGVSTYKSPEAEREGKLEALRKKITSPRVIYDELSRYVVGQEEAKRALSVGVYNHITRVTLALNGKPVQKSNILLIGPTGTGKTYMVKILARFLDLPLAIGNSTTITEAGYVGEDVEMLLWNLLESAGGNQKLAEVGIVFLDEVDKLAASNAGNLRRGSSRDVGGAGVQRALLKLMEGTASIVPEGGDKWGPGPRYCIETDNVLFIMAGAFTGLDELVEERLCVSAIGFERESMGGQVANSRNYLRDVETHDLVRFGMLPEFIGRLPVRVCLHNLSEDHLCDILMNVKEGPIKEFESLFQSNCGKITFGEDGVRALAREALKMQTGARGLRALVEKVMMPIIFEGVDSGNIVIDEDSVYCALRQEQKKVA